MCHDSCHDLQDAMLCYVAFAHRSRLLHATRRRAASEGIASHRMLSPGAAFVCYAVWEGGGARLPEKDVTSP